MSKNLTRKGIAFGALVALATSAFAGAPAQAAAGTGQLLLAPSSGAEWVTPSKNIFSVKVNYVAGYTNAQAAKLKLKITTAGGFVVDTDAASTTLATATASVVDNTVAANATSGTLALGADNIYAGLAIDSAVATTTYSVDIQAWEDSDLDGTIDSGEWTSNSETVTFIKNSGITWDLSVVEPVVTSAAATSTAYVKSNINLSQLAWADAASLGTMTFDEDTASAGTFAPAAGSEVATTVAYDSDNNRLTSTSANSAGAFAAGDKVKARFWFDNTGDSKANWQVAIRAATGIGQTPVATVTSTVATPTISAVGTATVTATAATAQSTTNATVLTGTSSITVKSKVTAVTGASKSGIPVKFTFAETGNSTLLAAGSVTSGTEILKNSNAGSVQTKNVTVSTDADGYAIATFALAGLEAGNSFIVTPSSQGFTTTGTTITVADETIGSIVNLDGIGGNSAVEEIVVAKDANFDLKFAVLNQFGKALNGAAYAVSVTDGTSTVYGSVVNGVATVNFPKFTTATSVDLTAQGKKNGVNAGSAVTVEVTVGTASTPAALTLNGSGSGTGTEADFGAVTAIALNTEAAFVAADTRKGETAADITSGEFVVVSGTVTTSAGAAALSTVTLSGAGLDFIADGVYAKDSITVTTSETGAYDVRVLSNLAGTKTLTVKSGTVTKTQDIKFAQAADTAGATVTITAANNVTPGGTIRYSGKLVDKFGNPVTVTHVAGSKTFTVSYNGPGFATSLPTSTDANGEFFVNVLTGVSDTGSATLTATYDADASGSTYAVKSASKSVTLGAAAATAAASGSTAKIYASATNAAGKTVVVKVNGKTVKSFAGTAAKKTVVVAATAGAKNVSVFVGGVKVLGKVVTVK